MILRNDISLFTFNFGQNKNTIPTYVRIRTFDYLFKMYVSDQTSLSLASDLGLHYLMKSVCPNTQINTVFIHANLAFAAYFHNSS